GGLPLQIADPPIPADALEIPRLHRPVPDFQRPEVPGFVPPAVPTLLAVHRRVLHPALHRPAVPVDRVYHPPPRVHVLPLAGDPQGVVEPHQGPLDAVAVLAAAGDGVDRAEPPAVHVAPPLAVGAADLAVKADLRRDDAVVLLHPLPPGIHVLQDP